jgi:hypothetical protein
LRLLQNAKSVADAVACCTFFKETRACQEAGSHRLREVLERKTNTRTEKGAGQPRSESVAIVNIFPEPAKNPREQARLVKTLVSNSTFDRGSLSPTYIKPFDVLARVEAKLEIGSPHWTISATG